MVKFKMEIPTEECLQRCLQTAKNNIAAYDDLKTHNVGFDVVIKAIRSDNVKSLWDQYGLKTKTAVTVLDMFIRDLAEDRRSYYEKVVEHLTPIVAMHIKDSTLLNPHLTFDTYHETEANSEAMQVAKEVIYSPGRRDINPLLLIGDFGCGKTHLVNAIGNAINKEHPEMTVFYVTGDEFKRRYMGAVISNRLTEFKDKYDKVDVLILDNIQDLVGPGTQNCFFHVMDQMYQKDKQIVLTCNKGLDDMKGLLEERIIEHLRWGITKAISKTDD